MVHLERACFRPAPASRTWTRPLASDQPLCRPLSEARRLLAQSGFRWQQFRTVILASESTTGPAPAWKASARSGRGRNWTIWPPAPAAPRRHGGAASGTMPGQARSNYLPARALRAAHGSFHAHDPVGGLRGRARRRKPTRPPWRTRASSWLPALARRPDLRFSLRLRSRFRQDCWPAPRPSPSVHSDIRPRPWP